MNKEEQFLKEYEALCQKYQMGLWGCGCCGSPSLNDINDINYDEKLNKVFIGYGKEKTIQEYFGDDRDE